MIYFYPFQRNQAQQKVDDKMCETEEEDEEKEEEEEEEEEKIDQLISLLSSLYQGTPERGCSRPIPLVFITTQGSLPNLSCAHSLEQGAVKAGQVTESQPNQISIFNVLYLYALKRFLCFSHDSCWLQREWDHSQGDVSQEDDQGQEHLHRLKQMEASVLWHRLLRQVRDHLVVSREMNVICFEFTLELW